MSQDYFVPDPTPLDAQPRRSCCVSKAGQRLWFLNVDITLCLKEPQTGSQKGPSAHTGLANAQLYTYTELRDPRFMMFP